MATTYWDQSRNVLYRLHSCCSLKVVMPGSNNSLWFSVYIRLDFQYSVCQHMKVDQISMTLQVNIVMRWLPEEKQWKPSIVKGGELFLFITIKLARLPFPVELTTSYRNQTKPLSNHRNKHCDIYIYIYISTICLWNKSIRTVFFTKFSTF